ncbi:MAG: Lar family restriction alleviation protein [Faecalimonas umbilicata]|uniref:Lar family restriction alleviation protein n=1 Tax=Faecalimonas umbilicata TaxID=1912855 RepID=UPI003993786C
MEELKKCPFCGGEASLKVNHGFGEEVISAFVYCEECGVATRNCALEATARGNVE